MNKKNIVILFGGFSTEHEISIETASNIISNMPEENYNIIPVYITREGKWLMYDGHAENIKNMHWERLGTQAFLSPDRVKKGLYRIVGDKVKLIPVDVVIPALHGKYGEDGTVQGLLELSGIPYIGCGVLASAVSMDKTYAKIVAKSLNIEQTKHVVFYRNKKIKAPRMGYPLFVKPARSGSSIGTSKAKDIKELHAAIDNAFQYDDKIIVEKAVEGRELECSVLGSAAAGVEVKASRVAEIIPAGEFYDYDAKYSDAGTVTVVPADIPEETERQIREISIKIFNAVGGSGLSRVDFFLCEKTGRVVFNEINTMPGFTSISMYPRLWQNAGISYPELIDELIRIAEMKNLHG